MKYKISEVSKMFGITSEAIRYYEGQDIIKPLKSDSSGYRNYNVWDIHALLQARAYRRYGYTLSETAQLINNSEIGDIVSSLEEKTEEIEKNLSFYTNLLQSIKQMKEINADADEYLGQFRVAQRPAMYRLENEGQYVLNSDPHIKKVTRTWIEHVPFVFTSARWTKEEYEKGGPNHYFGLCVEEQYADFLPEEKYPYISYIPSRPCVYTVIKSRPSITLTPQRLSPAIEYMQSEGLQLSGDVISRVVNYRKATTEYVNYHQIWLPFD